MMCRKFFVFLSLLLVFSLSVSALAPLKTGVKEEAAATSKKAVESTTTTSSDLLEISEKIDGLLLVSQGTKKELNTSVDALYKDLQDALAVNKRTRFFADLGAAFGLKEKALQYGATADIGLKFGCGLMVKVGAIYMIGSDFKNISWGLDNLTATATVGWEW